MKEFNLTAPEFITNQTLSITLAVVFFVYAILSIVLLYHWYKFARKSGTVFIAQTVYFSVSLVLLVGALISIVTF